MRYSLDLETSSSQQAVEDHGRGLAGIQEHMESNFPQEDAGDGGRQPSQARH